MSNTSTVEELNLDQKVTVKSIAPWMVGFARIDSIGDVTIVANGTTRLSRNEIISQINRGNILFTGTDVRGSHATLYIDDAPTRAYVDFDSEDGSRTQMCLTDNAVKEVFSAKTQKAFEDKFSNLIVTRAEKAAVMDIIKKLKINDYSKIRFAEEYTGIQMR